MTAEINLAGASFHSEVGWHAIDWQKVHRNVRRLQTRIVKATQEGRWGKVKALQRLLTRSFSGKALAVKRVTENQGKRTAGVDGEIWDKPAKKSQAVQSLRQHGYRAQPLKRVYIPKGNDKIGVRGLSIPTMRDRAMQTLYKLALDPIAETLGDPNSYGFRTARSTADAIERAFLCLSHKGSAQWILDADIKACFDAISHQWLLEHIPLEPGIFRQWLKAGYLEEQIYYQTETGVPQGGTISPVVTNMTLDGLEKMLVEHFPKTASSNPQVYLCRFADDLIITGRSKRLLEQEVQPLVEQFLRTRGLSLSPEKTKIVHIKAGFDFLGQNIRKYNHKLLIKPAPKNIKALLTKVRAVIKANRQATAGYLILQLNPIIRGWANFHRHVVSKETFIKVDSHIFHALWQWAKRRHPNKPKRWIKTKYFKRGQGRKWNFQGQHPNRHQEQRHLILIRAADTPIRRHAKVKAEANPFDPGWELYFEKRLETKMRNVLQDQYTLLTPWQEQDGVCPICQQKITAQTGWHKHHLIWQVHGGKDTLDNLVLLHPNCHRQLHSQGLTVGKPRPKLGVRGA